MATRRPEPRKVPRQARSRALYDAIVTAAGELLERTGPDFTLEGVATRAGVSPGSLYQYFPDRPALVGALIDRQVEHDRRLLDAFRETAVPVGDPAELLVDGALGLYGNQPALMAHMASLLREVGRSADVEGLIGEFSGILARVLHGQHPERSHPECDDAARAAIHAVLGIVRKVAQDEPDRLLAPDTKARLLAVARAALGG